MEVLKYRSLPSQNKWEPYTPETEEIIREDFRRLWGTGFLSDLWVEVVDEPWRTALLGSA